MFMLKLNPKLLQEAFPINKVEVFFDAEDHSNFLGFTWEMISQGRVPVGLDNTDKDFNKIGKTGGGTYKDKVKVSGTAYGATNSNPIYNGQLLVSTAKNTGSGTQTLTDNGIDFKDPYIVMAFWKRTA